ncbi:uncharacterized protein LOC115062285 [Echeneis naucrates]|uniref:uncharacterized protein LOC115062285 n=1 Tax=Echeneis naucrates TaxID=173247 RepID=UPI001113EF92|nr:uncharacterized protein LOC115062285 [Echeneis naucrates]
MDKLKSKKERLCELLSRDPSYILEQCGDILSMNEFKEVQKQSSAPEKMSMLLKIIIEKGGDHCETFWDILRQHQNHYGQLPQLLCSSTQGSPAPTIFADSGSVVTMKEIANVSAKTMKFRIEAAPGSYPSGNVGGHFPRADYCAQGGSVITADKISGVTVDEIDFTVSLKPTSGHAGPAYGTPPSSQGPAVKLILKHKSELIDCLRADPSFILQHTHARNIVTDREYQNLKCINQPEEAVIKLIDKVIDKGQEYCSAFNELLREREIVSTYPKLKGITNN